MYEKMRMEDRLRELRERIKNGEDYARVREEIYEIEMRLANTPYYWD